MDKKKSKAKNISESTEYMDVLNKLKWTLYFMAILLLVNLVFNIICTSNLKELSTKYLETLKGSDSSENEELPEYDVSEFTEVDYSGLKNIMKDKGTHVVYMGRSTCGYCAMFIPIMKEAQSKYDFKTYYFDVTRVFNYENNKVVDEDAYEKLTTYNEFFEKNFLATPMIAIFKDGKYVDGTIGYQDLDTYSAFLEKNNFKKSN